MLKFSLYVLFLLIFCSLSVFSQTWRTNEIFLDDHITDGLVADLTGSGKMDLLLIGGNSVYIYFQGKEGFSHHPDQRIYFRHLGDFIGVANADPSNPGLELIGLSKDGLKCFRHDGSHYIECPGFLIATEVSMPTERLGPLISNFSIDLNKNGQDEFIILQRNKLFIYHQKEFGRFDVIGIEGVKEDKSASINSRLVSKKRRSATTSNNLLYLFQPGISVKNTVLFQDVNRDGRLDMVSKTMHLQGSGLQFLPEISSYYNEMIYPFEGKYKIFLDLDGDGNLDLIYIEPKDILTENINIFPFVKIYIHFQKNGVFPKTPDFFFKTIFTDNQLPFLDINGDGALDIISIWPEITPGSKQDIVNILMDSTFQYSFRCYFYDWNKRGYALSPDIQLKAEIKQEPSRALIDSPFDIGGDFDGNGINDILIRKDSGSFFIYFLDEKRKGYVMLVKRLNIPGTIIGYRINDLNGNGKSDLLVFGEKTVRIYFSE